MHFPAKCGRRVIQLSYWMMSVIFPNKLEYISSSTKLCEYIISITGENKGRVSSGRISTW